MKFILLISSLLLFSKPVTAKLVKFQVDKAHSSIGFSVKHLGLVPVKGRFTKFEGTFDYDVKKEQIKNIYIKIDADSINTDNPDRDAHLRNQDFFHVRNDTYDIVKKNRYIEFWADTYSIKSTRHKGQLKILKIKQNVDLNIQTKVLTSLKNRIGIMAKGKINRQKFGLTWQKAGTSKKLAGKLVGDEVTLDINMAFMTKY